MNCLRCSHRWKGRQKRRPVQCPDCRSPYWNRVRAALVVEAILAAKAPAEEAPAEEAAVKAPSKDVKARRHDWANCLVHRCGMCAAVKL